MTYEDVYRILREQDRNLEERYRDLVPQFRLMEELAEVLTRRRSKRGAIDFDFPETKVKLGDKGKPVAIIPRPRTIAERIIEEFMLVANETVAQHFAHMGNPFIYRVHEKPASDKIKELNEFIHNFGYHIKGGYDDIHPKALQQMLEKAKGERYHRLISTVTLRSLRQANTEQILATLAWRQNITHFTSPIRRYLTSWFTVSSPTGWERRRPGPGTPRSRSSRNWPITAPAGSGSPRRQTGSRWT